MRQDHLDYVAVGYDGDSLAGMLLYQAIQGIDGAKLGITHGFAVREIGAAWKMLDDAPHFALCQLPNLLAGPIAVADFANIFEQLQSQVWVVFKDGLGSLDCAFQWA